MDTEIYCKSLDNLNKKRAIQAIHEAYLQLSAIGETINDSKKTDFLIYDNRSAIKRLEECLRDAGHIGFIE